MARELLSEAIDSYMILRSSQDFSKNTIRNDAGILRRFLAVTGNIWVHQITENHTTRYFEDAGKTRAARSLRNDHTILNQFFSWARRTKRLPLDMDPMAGRRRPKAAVRERQRVPVAQFNRLLDVAGERDPRNRAIVAVLLYTLIREQECADLRIGDWKRDEGWLRVRVTKSGVEDEMPVCAELDAELRTWMTHYSAEAKRPLLPHDLLLPRRRSIRVARDEARGCITGHDMIYVPDQKLRTLGRVVKEALDDFGLALVDGNGQPLMEGAHTLRRSGARALFDRLAADGYDGALRITQSMLHHKSVTQTEAYVGITADRRSRDELLRLQTMFPTDLDNVVALHV